MNSYFSKHLLDEAVRHEKAKDEFQNISGVYNELVQLEKSMSQLLDLFIQVATLVAEQQTSIDNIEHYLNDASAGQEGMVRRLQIKRAQKWF
jgi:t-SNARE complex subunit (syntaxin)